MKMAASFTSYSSLALIHVPNTSISTRMAVSPPFTKTHPTEQKKIRMKKGACFPRARRFHLLTVAGAAADASATRRPPSPAEMVKRLFTCINGNNMNGLNEIISEDCCIDDFSFSKPFEGNKEVMSFYRELATSMGKNAKFKIETIKEDKVTAWVNWHLEWKETQIPFTRGCSSYEFSEGEQGLVVRKAQVISESPIKPGHLALILLKTVTSLFDEFPKAAEWFLKSPQVVIQWAGQIYTLLLAPFINPLITSYVNFWRLTARTLAYAISILIYIIKIFFN